MRTVSWVRPPGSGFQVISALPIARPVRMTEQSDGHEEQIEQRGDEGDALPGPVAMGHESDEEDDPSAEDGDGGADAEKSEAGADGDELGDQREEVADHEIDHGEPSPEGTEAIEDEFGMTAMSGGAEAHSHFLNDAGHEEGEHDEGQEEADAEARSGSGVGEHAGAIIFAEHDENARTDEQPEEAGARPESALGPGLRDSLAVVGAVDIFVGDDDCAGRRYWIIRFGIAEGDRSWSVFTPAPRRCVSLVHSLTQARGSIRSADN